MGDIKTSGKVGDYRGKRIVSAVLGVACAAGFIYGILTESEIKPAVIMGLISPGNTGFNAFLASMLKHGKYFFGVWICAFIPFGCYAALLAAAVKLFSIGYTSGVVIRLFGIHGIRYMLTLYAPQSIIIIAGIYFLLLRTIEYSNNSPKKPDDFLNFAKKLSEYYRSFAFGLLILTLCAVFERFFAIFVLLSLK